MECLAIGWYIKSHKSDPGIVAVGCMLFQLVGSRCIEDVVSGYVALARLDSGPEL
jgi:hypothetical protein